MARLFQLLLVPALAAAEAAQQAPSQRRPSDQLERWRLRLPVPPQLVLPQLQLPPTPKLDLSFPRLQLPTMPWNSGDRSSSGREASGDTLAFVHATCPGVVRPIDARQHGPRAAIGQAMLSLHAGRSLGRAGDPLVVFAGLAAAVLAGSGLYIWVARHLTCRRTRHSGRTMAFE